MSGTRPSKLQKLKKEYLWGTEEWFLWDSPLLMKIITAEQALSVQVHPNDAYAKEKEGCSGKTEMWYVLDAKPGAFLYYGLKHRISANEFLKRIENGTITEVCQKVPVKKGNVFYIPAGLVHAIGAGITVAEIQQNSNITYRCFDYERKDASGQPRQLHIQQAAEVAGFLPPLQGHRPMGLADRRKGYTKTLLVQCPYFTVTHYEVFENVLEQRKAEVTVFYVIEGSGILRTEDEVLGIREGECICIPDKIKHYEFVGKLELLKSEAAK